MAIRRGNVNVLTPNTIKAMRRNAELLRCPTCGRKSALRIVRDWGGEGVHLKYCKWSEQKPKLCTYQVIKGLDSLPGDPAKGER